MVFDFITENKSEMIKKSQFQDSLEIIMIMSHLLWMRAHSYAYRTVCPHIILSFSYLPTSDKSILKFDILYFAEKMH